MLLHAGQGGEMAGLDAMIQLDGLALGGDEVEPAPGYVELGKSENGVGDFVAMMMVVEEPGVEVLLPQSLLNRFQVHREILYRALGRLLTRRGKLGNVNGAIRLLERWGVVLLYGAQHGRSKALGRRVR